MRSLVHHPLSVAVREAWLVLAAVFLLAGAFQAEAAAEEAPLELWLTLGPATLPPLAYGDLPAATVRDRIFADPPLAPADLWPEAGDAVAWMAGRGLTWEAVNAPGGRIRWKAPAQGESLAMAQTYLRAASWSEATLTVVSRHPVIVFVDGKEAAQSTATKKPSEDSSEAEAELKLKRGLHRVSLLTWYDPAAGDWALRVSLKGGSGLDATVSPRHAFDYREKYAVEDIASVALSPDGGRIALILRATDLEADSSETRIEIRSAADGSLVRAIRAGSGHGNPAFSPDGKKLVYSASSPGGKGAQDLWLVDVETGTAETVLEGKRGLSSPMWSPDGRTLYLLATAPRKRPAETPPCDRFTEIRHRWTDWKDCSQVFSLTLQDGVWLQRTGGLSSTTAFDLSADGSRMVLFREISLSTRPYSKTEVWTLDLPSEKAGRVHEAYREPPGPSRVAISPDGTRAAFIASASELLPEEGNVEHNAYDTDLFLLDLEGGALRNLTEDFDPSAGSDFIGAREGRSNLWWDPNGGRILLLTTDRRHTNLYAVPADGGAIERVALPDPVVSYPDMAPAKGLMAFVGEAPLSPPALKLIHLPSGGERVLLEPWRDLAKRLRFGEVETFDFVNASGDTIDGWLFLPPGFDGKEKIPLIVYYYGGTIPMAEGFRLSFHYLAANGYAVYCSNPRGAVGYGREFADHHMNDWGPKAGADVLEGTEKLLAAKPYLDETKIGCYGGSFGGFLTLYLIAHSDRFAAAVDWYGISNLASYWGGGWWGVGYSDSAMKRSYPWNRRDLFVDRSPLYMADRIDTPLLLLHGHDDVNVPSLESDQIFAALKVLGRDDVEYVRFEGEDHGIRGKPSNDVASTEMMLEWFDKWLKNEPGAWNHRWKETLQEEGLK